MSYVTAKLTTSKLTVRDCVMSRPSPLRHLMKVMALT